MPIYKTPAVHSTHSTLSPTAPKGAPAASRTASGGAPAALTTAPEGVPAASTTALGGAPVALTTAPGGAPAASTAEAPSPSPTQGPVLSPIRGPRLSLAALAASPAELSAAFERQRPQREALTDDELGRITANVPSVVIIALGASHNVEPLRDEIERQLPAHDMESFDNLRGYALSLLFAHLMTQPSAELETRMQALLAEGGQRRAHLLGMAEALALLGLVDAERVASIRRGSGHADTAQDLVALAQLFYDHRAELEGKTPFTSDDIARAHTLGIELLDWLGRRRVGNDGARAPGPDEEARLRAFRLLVRAYDATYAAVAYVRRREGDVDVLMPSLFGGRGRRRSASELEAPTEPEAPVDPEAPAEPNAPVDPEAPAEPNAPVDLDAPADSQATGAE